MLDALKSLLAPREEVVEIGGVRLIVRELTTASDVAGLGVDSDAVYRLTVRCVFAESGEPAFADDDIAEMKRTALTAFSTIVHAVRRVNGLDLDDSVKNSSGDPSSA